MIQAIEHLELAINKCTTNLSLMIELAKVYLDYEKSKFATSIVSSNQNGDSNSHPTLYNFTSKAIKLLKANECKTYFAFENPASSSS